jgi:hypothetical protein
MKQNHHIQVDDFNVYLSNSKSESAPSYNHIQDRLDGFGIEIKMGKKQRL